MQDHLESQAIVGKTIADSTPHWPAKPTPPQGAPNVLVVLFDDVGFSDFGCYGSPIDTPAIDRLSAGGLTYTGFHTTAMCSTTRAALLTGRNHHSVGVGSLANFDSGFPGYTGKIDKNAATMAEVLDEQGYRTYMLGKWHVTPLHETGPTGPFDGWPLARGFDRFYGFLDAETDQYAPELVADNSHITPPGTYETGYHLSSDITDKALEFIKGHEAGSPDTPWFTWIAFGACHAPHQAPRELVDKYDERFRRGWDVERDERLARQIELGIVPEGTELPPRNDMVKAWDEHSTDEQRLFSRLQGAYAAMLEHADQNIARVLDHLEASGQLDNTLVLVLSDNGASQEGGPSGFVNAMGPYNFVPEPIAAKIARIDDIGGPDTHSNFPWGWAMTANTPLRRYKQNTHGGGIRDPLVVHWPERIPDPGLRHQFCHASDVLPTLLDLVGLEAPPEVAGVKQTPLEGDSFAATVSNPNAKTNKTSQYFEMFGHRGMWRDGWKAVAFHPPGTPFEQDVWELFNLETDFNETTDLAATHPEMLADLQAAWWAEAEAHQVLPLDDRFAPRFAENAARHTGDRTDFTFWKGMGHLPSDVAPDLRSRSYLITAHVEIPETGAEGVLIAHGDATTGYSLFVEDGHLVHDLNIGGSHQILRSETPVPSGPHQLGFHMSRIKGDPDHPHHGVGTLLVDGEEVGRFETNNIFFLMVSWSGLDVGFDRGSPVSHYAAPFAFTGSLIKVTVGLEYDQELDADGVMAAELARE
ncbi:MAG: arylsulfatase [Acidimicrobiales bacterium]